MINMRNIFLRIILISGFSLFLFENVNAFQDEEKEIAEFEMEISSFFEQLRKSQDDVEKLEINKNVIDVFNRMLSIEGSFDFPFDSLKYLGKIYSPDKLLRIFSWNVPMLDGTHRYFGYIQHKSSENGSLKVYFLDDSKNSRLTEDEVFTSDNWYGALYYEIIKTECQNKVFYTILGFAFNNYLTNYKIVDVLSFNNREIIFGSPIFKVEESLNFRKIFEYSARVSMMMRYENERSMIVFDHLSPSQPDYEGQFQFYGPDSSYDGLEFRNCIWNLIEDLNLTNKERN